MHEHASDGESRIFELYTKDLCAPESGQRVRADILPS
jgi:hypothetical protein